MNPTAPPGSDPSFEEVYDSLCADPDVDGLTRRRFLQGALVIGGGVALAGPLSNALSAAAAPLGADEGILVVVQLGGGNDGLNTLIPTGESAYRTLRPSMGIPAKDIRPIATGFGLHPALAHLQQRFKDGKLAVIRGVGVPERDHSHFTSMATWMAGTSGPDRRTGWLGRWLDTVGDSNQGLRGIAVGSSVPLHLAGTRSQITSLPVGRAPYGGSRADVWDAMAMDALSAYGGASSGKGHWGDALAQASRSAMSRAGSVASLYPEGAKPPAGQVVPQLHLAAKLVNLDLGVRVITVTLGSFDTHDHQPWQHNSLLGDLDKGIATLFSTLDAKWRDRVTLMTFSEFGRRAEQNAGYGTDHGTSSVAFVVGDQVRGGLYGKQPLLSQLDSRGDLDVTTDYRSLYGSVLTGWLGGNAAQVLGGSYPDLKLFASPPGKVVAPVDPRFAPFTSATAFVEQQYTDMLGRAPDAGGLSYWTGRLTSGSITKASFVRYCIASAEFGEAIRPAAQVALIGLGGPPAFTDIMGWAAALRSGQPLVDVARQVVTRAAYAERFGPLSGPALVDALHRSGTGSAAPASFVAQWSAAPPADVLAAVSNLVAATRHQSPPVDVLMSYAGLLRRSPDAGGMAFWTDRVRKGMTLDRLIGSFLDSGEYHGRFAQ